MMNWFKNLKIGVKLISGFILVSVIGGIIGIIAVINMKELDYRDTFLYEKTTLPLAYLGNMSTFFQRIRVNCCMILTAEKKEQVEDFIIRINNYDEKFQNYSKLYENGYIDENDKKDHKELLKLFPV